jgi:ABC-type transport system substrate-binding protein
MATNRSKRVLALFLAFAFVLMAVSPMFSSAQTLPGSAKSGPYLNKLVYNVITQPDQAVLALQNDQIDLIGDMVDPSFLGTLTSAQNINVTNVLRNGYGYVTINTAKYPYNITAFRRALAFALDKNAISDDVWAGLSSPQDSCVPQVNPFSVESQLTTTYYEANVALGAQLLAAAGFNDTNGDGYLEAPNGQSFSVKVECAQSSPIAQQVGTLVAAALNALHVQAVSVPTDFYEYLNRLYYHGDYDIVFLGASFTNFDVDWLGYEFASSYANVPYYNFPNFQNASYDSWIEQLLHSTDYNDVYQAAIEMQKVWVYQCPEIICYENTLLSAYRTDKFEGFVNDVSAGVPGWWTNEKVHLKDSLGGPFGGTFRWSNPLDLDTFNFMVSSSAYTMNVLNEMYDSLITQNSKGEDVMWLAESYTAQTHADNPAIPAGHTRFTFQMLQNATWSDGTQLTAEDAAFSLNYYRDSPGNPYGVDLTEMTAAYAPTPYTLVVEFDTVSYWHLHTVAYKPIIPKHVFENVGLNGWNTWNPNPPNEAMVTSGPFNVSDYVAGEFTELTYNPNYFYGLDRTTTPTTTATGIPIGDLMLAIVAGAVGAAVVILVGGYVLMRQR